MFRYLKWIFHCLLVQAVSTKNVRIAKTRDEIRAVYEFRKKVFVEELNTAFENDKLLIDVCDYLSSSVNIMYVEDGEILGSMRFTYFGENLPSFILQKHRLDKFSLLKGLRFTQIRFLAVSRHARNKKILPCLAKFMLEYFQENSLKTHVFFTLCIPGLASYYSPFAMENYSSHFSVEESGSFLLMLGNVTNLKSFKEASSPFYFLIKAYVRRVFDLSDMLLGDELESAIRSCDKAYFDDNESVSKNLDSFFSSYEQKLHAIDSDLKCLISLISEAVIKVEPGVLVSGQEYLDQELYLIVEGDIRVVHNGQNITKLGPGEVVGEMAFFMEEKKRTADIVANTNVVMVLIRRGDLRRMLKRNDACSMKLMRFFVTNLAYRLSATTNRLTH